METTRLARWLEESKDDCQRTWSVVDTELYQPCSRKGHDRLEDVCAKVAFVNRVYMAGISQSVSEDVGSDTELRVSKIPVNCKQKVLAHLSELAVLDHLTRESIKTIVAAHRSVTRRLGEGVRAKNLCSFVSKYLRFHCPIVSIYDSRVIESIGRVAFVSRASSIHAYRPTAGAPPVYWSSPCLL